MEIRKTYDMCSLKEELKEKIEKAAKNGTSRVAINMLTAQEIFEVLEEIYEREQKQMKWIHTTSRKRICLVVLEDINQMHMSVRIVCIIENVRYRQR